ncbi:MAG: TIR domain-containing protein [Alphaproteobacteria bacterium]|nr:TIR domain-containing protein [Alphaproteobacteria bacterium]
MTSEQQLKVFISYAWESEALREAVRALAQWLEERNCEVWTDHDKNLAPTPGWITWMRSCLKDAVTVLVVATPSMKASWDEEWQPRGRRGTRAEGAWARQYIYENGMQNDKFVPIIPDDGSDNDVPEFLRDWSCGLRFPSGNERILDAIFEAQRRAGAQSVAPVDQSDFDWTIGDHHQRLAVGLLDEGGGRALVHALQGRLARNFNLSSPPETGEALVAWLADEDLNEKALVRLLRNIRGALLDIDKRKPASAPGLRREAEQAAAALYCLTAFRLVNCAAHSNGDYIVRVPCKDQVIFAIVTTALFGGALHLIPSNDPELPTGRHIYEFKIPSGGHRFRQALEWEAHNALCENRRETTSNALDAGELNEVQRENLIARIGSIREEYEESLALIVGGAIDEESLRSFANDHEVPVMLEGVPERELLRLEANAIRAEIREFWLRLQTIQDWPRTKSHRQPRNSKSKSAS